MYKVNYIHDDQVGFFSGVQDWLKIWKQIIQYNLLYYYQQVKKENEHISWGRKIFDRIQ